MKLEVKNKEIISVINFLDSLKLGGLKGVHRSNLSMKLRESLEKVMEAEKKIIEDYKHDDEKRNRDLKELHNEYVIIDSGDSRAMLESVKKTINDIVKDEEQEFEGENALSLALLYNQFGKD